MSIGVSVSILVILGIATAWTAEPQPLPPSEMLATPGDPAQSKELAARFAASGSLISGPTTNVAPPAASPARPPLTSESLQKMLEDLGYSPKAVKLPTGETAYNLTIARGTWTLRPNVTLVANASHLAILHYVTQKIDTAKVDGSRWQKLLETNLAAAPNVFALIAPTQQLILYHTERNVDISPALLRQWLDQSMDVVIVTHDQWKGMDAPAMSVPAPAPAK
jgi:hypothetical protein